MSVGRVVPSNLKGMRRALNANAEILQAVAAAADKHEHQIDALLSGQAANDQRLNDLADRGFLGRLRWLLTGQ